MKFFLCVIGMVMIVEGLPWFGFPDHAKKTMAQLHLQPESVLRRMGFILMLLGLFLVYIGKH